MDLSIIIPVYNVDKYIGECIKSISKAVGHSTLSNAESSIEVILVDDGSTDSSGEIIDSLVNDESDNLDSFLGSGRVSYRVVRQDNHGVAYARNHGLELAQGEYVWFVDSDDEVTIDSIGIILTSIKNNQNTDVLLFDGENGWNHFEESFSLGIEDSKEFLSAGSLYFPIMKQYDKKYSSKVSMAAPWDKVIKRSVLTSNALRFDEDLKVLDDMVFCMKLFGVAGTVSYMPTSIYKYRLVEESITHKYTPNRIDLDINVWDKVYEYVVKSNNCNESVGLSEGKLSEDKHKLYFEGKNILFMQAVYLRGIKSFAISCDRQIFNKNNLNEFKEKMSVLKETVCGIDYYREAFGNVNIQYAEWRLKPVILLIKMRVYYGVYLLCMLNKLLK